METTPLKITISPPVQETKLPEAAAESSFFGGDGFSFKDILDSINPFQQVPILSAMYREESGDTISAASRLAGGAIFGGPIGFLLAVVNSAIEDATGKDFAGNLLASFKDENESEVEVTYDDPMPTYGAARKGYSAYVRSQSLLS